MKKQEVAKKMSRHDEREIKDYVKFNPNSLNFKGKKGKESLLRPKKEKNEGEHLTVGKRGDEEPVA